MKKTVALLAAMLFCVLGPAYALYTVSEQGEWPKSWPRELDPLRKQARTMVGPMVPERHYAIRFTSRKEFESAWPYLLKVKTRAAPIFLIRSSYFFLSDHNKAGVIVHTPPLGQSKNPATPEAPIPGETNPRQRWAQTTVLEVMVDDDIIDWKHIALPKGTVVIDQRDQAKEKQP